MIGRRFIEHESYKRAREERFAGELPSGVELLDGPELRSLLRLRTYSDLTAFEIDGVPYPAELPAVAWVPQLVETIPVESIQVYLGQELTEDAMAGPANDGQPLPEIEVDFGTYAGSPTKLPRFGSAAPVTNGALDEPGIVRSIIERRMRLGFPLGLENEILTGAGGMWTGITQLSTNATGDSTHAIAVAKSDYRASALVTACGKVQDNGYKGRPLQIVSSPDVKAATFTEKDTGGTGRPLPVADMLADYVDHWVVSNSMPAGEAVVGDLFEAVALFMRGGAEIDLSRNHSDFLTRGMVEMTLATRCYSWIRQPDAIAIVSGL